MASTHFDDGNHDSTGPIEQESCRPDAQILCYAHIAYTPYITHDPDFMDRFFGKGYTQADVDNIEAFM